MEKFKVLFFDDVLAVVYKPAGLLSVAYEGQRGNTALSVLEEYMRKNGTWKRQHRPFCVHRLDRETSGVMMFALSEKSRDVIMNTWHKMVTSRIYHAVAENPEAQALRLLQKRNIAPLADEGVIDLPLAQNKYHQSYVPDLPVSPKLKTESARTHYKVLDRTERYTLFELSLDTGRKNQIRAHLAHFGYPLAGDTAYRAKTDPFHRLALHARTLEFVHPITGEAMKFEVAEPFGIK